MVWGPRGMKPWNAAWRGMANVYVSFVLYRGDVGVVPVHQGLLVWMRDVFQDFDAKTLLSHDADFRTLHLNLKLQDASQNYYLSVLFTAKKLRRLTISITYAPRPFIASMKNARIMP
jgi:hypothetical protein